MSTFDDIRNERIKKLEALRASGVNPYPIHSSRTISCEDFTSKFGELQDSGKIETVAGRVMSLRGQGGIMFVDIFDGTGKAQVVFQESEMNADLFTLFSTTVDKGDFLEIEGAAFTTKRGAPSLKASSWRMLSKSLRPIPDEWYGLKDEELRLREREIAILLDADLRAIFIRKSAFWRAVRSFLESRDFIEVETPVLETSPGGADARPFLTHHNALDIDAYLRISAGELWQKRLLVAGFPKVFEIGRIFRNEGQSSEHVQDYTQCEWYEAYSDYEKGMVMVRDLYRFIASTVYGREKFTIRGHEVDLSIDWPKIHFGEEIKKQFGIDPFYCTEEEAILSAKKGGVELESGANKARAVDQMWKSIRKTIAGPAFLVGVPVFLEPLAKRSEKNPDEVERFQVILAGSEMGKGFSELNNPLDQRTRFEEQEILRAGGDLEAQRLDESYLNAMEYGMPPAFGFGVSERLFAFFEDKSAHETQLFPLLRPKE
ncbi:MAG: lysine--tRNA ligase [Patescibacteria group bacterium]